MLNDARLKKTLIVTGFATAITALVLAPVVGNAHAERFAAAQLTAAHVERMEQEAERGAALTEAGEKRVAIEEAKAAIDTAQTVVADVEAKIDATPLESKVDALTDFAGLSTVRIIVLTSQTENLTGVAVAEAAEVDRLAAEAEAARVAELAAAAAAAEAARVAAEAEALRQVNTPDGARAVARNMAANQFGWGDGEFNCLNRLWQKESGWSYTAYNPSGAHGIPQSLPGSKMSSAGADWQTNAATQIRWGLGYISGRYGSPCAAWSHSVNVGWY